MKITWAVLAQGILSGSLADLVTVEAGITYEIRAATFANVTGAPLDLTAKLVDQTAGTARTVIDARPLADEETYLAPELIGHILLTGGKIQGQGNGIEYFISGFKIVQ